MYTCTCSIPCVHCLSCRAFHEPWFEVFPSNGRWASLFAVCLHELKLCPSLCPELLFVSLSAFWCPYVRSFKATGLHGQSTQQLWSNLPGIIIRMALLTLLSALLDFCSLWTRFSLCCCCCSGEHASWLCLSCYCVCWTRKVCSLVDYNSPLRAGLNCACLKPDVFCCSPCFHFQYDNYYFVPAAPIRSHVTAVAALLDVVKEYRVCFVL